MPYDEDGDFIAAKETPVAELTFTISGFEPEALAEAVVAKIAAERARQIESLLDEKISARVQQLVDDAITVQIDDHVKKLLDEGFQPTNSYGRKTGERKTVGDMIVDALQPRNNYGGRNELPAIISDVVRRDFEKEIVEARTRLRAAVDATISEKLNEALRDALGFKAGR